MFDGALRILLETEESPITFASHNSSKRKAPGWLALLAIQKGPVPYILFPAGPFSSILFLRGLVEACDVGPVIASKQRVILIMGHHLMEN